MSELTLYLNFNGNCQQAFEFYQSVFGGELTDRQTFGEMPGNTADPSEVNKLIHIRLKVENLSLMGSDRPNSMGPVVFGNAYSVNYNTSDTTAGEEVFHKLAEGGEITMPLQDTFWGAKYGQLVDQFGIQWMVNIQK